MKFRDLAAIFSRQKLILRVGAFGMAVLLWFFVVSGDEYSVVMKMPLEARNLSARKALKEEVPEFIQVRFMGTGHALFKALLLSDFFDDFKLVIDLDRISEEYEFVLNDYYRQYPQKVVIPPSFDLEYVEVVYPREIHISLDEYLVKSVPVKPRILISPSPGYVQIGEIKVTPATIDIAGPEELMQSIDWVETEQDTLLDIQYSINQQIALMRPSRLIEFSLTKVNFKVDIQAISDRIISEVPVQIVNVPSGFRVFVNPRTVSLTIFGGVHRIAEIYPEDFFIYIDFEKQWDPKIQFYKPTIVTPNDILEWQDLSPMNVELVVTREAS